MQYSGFAVVFRKLILYNQGPYLLPVSTCNKYLDTECMRNIYCCVSYFIQNQKQSLNSIALQIVSLRFEIKTTFLVKTNFYVFYI